MHAEPSGHDSYFIAVDLAATALGVSKAQVYVLAHRYKWRRSPGSPAGYLFADVQMTARKRREAKDDPRKGARPSARDTPLHNGNTKGA